MAEVAAMRGTSPEDTAIDLVIQDGSRVGVVYFLMSEANVRSQIALPFMSFGSDAEAPAAGAVCVRAGGGVMRRCFHGAGGQPCFCVVEK